MKNSWEANVRKVTPYTPGDQPNRPKMIKLNTNENPYPPAPGVTRALKEFRTDQLRLYPDPKSSELLEVIAAQYQVKPEQVFVGVGSDDVLALAFLTFFHSEKPVLFPDISYSFYPVWAEVFRIPYETPALDEHFRIVKEDYYRENGGVVFPNPNAPTSLAMGRSDVEDIVRRNPDSVVIVDEAYVDFGAESAVRLTDTYENLLVVQTFSKSRSLAGMRIGFAVGSEKLIGYLKDVKFSFNSYTLNLPSIELGAAAVSDDAYFRETVNKIIRTRRRAARELSGLGFSLTDSMGNFLFASHETVPASELFAALRSSGIYVRYWNRPRIDNCLRITVGTDGQMDRLVEFLKKYLSDRRKKND